MSGFKVLCVDHVNVTTPAELEKEVLGWYRTCLGLTQIDKPQGTRKGGAWFEAGGVQIHVSIDQHNPHKKAHFGIVVSNFSGVVEGLRGAGCHIEQARPIHGRHRCYTCDPAGNRIELVAYDDKETVVEYEESTVGGTTSA